MARRTEPPSQRLFPASFGGEKGRRESKTIIARVTTVGSFERFTRRLGARPAWKESSWAWSIAKAQPTLRESDSVGVHVSRPLPLGNPLGASVKVGAERLTHGAHPLIHPTRNPIPKTVR